MTSDALADTESPQHGLPAHDYATSHVSRHRWPWTTEEYVTVPIIGAVVALIARATGAAFRLDGDIAWTIAAVCGVVASALVIRLGWVRKARSGFIFTIDNGVASITSAGFLESSRVDLGRITHVSQRNFGSDKCWLIGDGNSTLRFPLRAAVGSPVGASLIREVITRQGVRVDPVAQRLHDDHKDLISSAAAR